MYISHNSRCNLCRKQRMRKCYVITWKMYAQCLAGTVTNNSIGQNMLSALGRPDIFHGETYFRGRALDLKVDVGSADNMRTDNIFLHFTSQPVVRTYLACLVARKRARARDTYGATFQFVDFSESSKAVNFR